VGEIFTRVSLKDIWSVPAIWHCQESRGKNRPSLLKVCKGNWFSIGHEGAESMIPITQRSRNCLWVIGPRRSVQERVCTWLKEQSRSYLQDSKTKGVLSFMDLVNKEIKTSHRGGRLKPSPYLQTGLY